MLNKCGSKGGRALNTRRMSASGCPTVALSWQQCLGVDLLDNSHGDVLGLGNGQEASMGWFTRQRHGSLPAGAAAMVAVLTGAFQGDVAAQESRCSGIHISSAVR